MIRHGDAEQFPRLVQAAREAVILRARRGVAARVVVCDDHVRRAAADRGLEHLALVKGNLAGKEAVLCRMHSECMTGDVFGSRRCDCGEQLQRALRQIEAEGQGVLLYLRQEGRGIGLLNKLKAYALQEQGLDTVDANRALGFPDDLRNYAPAAAMLRALGVRSLRLMTNNPDKIAQLTDFGIPVTSRVSIEIPANRHDIRYLRTKRQRMGHLLDSTLLRESC